MENLETNAVKEPDLVANADLLALAAPESFQESAISTAQGNFQSTTPEVCLCIFIFILMFIHHGVHSVVFEAALLANKHKLRYLEV